MLTPSPRTLDHSQAFTLHPTPYTPHSTSNNYTLHPTLYTLHPTTYTLHPSPYHCHLAALTIRPTRPISDLRLTLTATAHLRGSVKVNLRSNGLAFQVHLRSEIGGFGLFLSRRIHLLISFRKSTPPQNRQLNISISNSRQ